MPDFLPLETVTNTDFDLEKCRYAPKDDPEQLSCSFVDGGFHFVSTSCHTCTTANFLYNLLAQLEQEEVGHRPED